MRFAKPCHVADFDCLDVMAVTCALCEPCSCQHHGSRSCHPTVMCHTFSTMMLTQAMRVMMTLALWQRQSMMVCPLIAASQTQSMTLVGVLASELLRAVSCVCGVHRNKVTLTHTTETAQAHPHSIITSAAHHVFHHAHAHCRHDAVQDHATRCQCRQTIVSSTLAQPLMQTAPSHTQAVARPLHGQSASPPPHHSSSGPHAHTVCKTWYDITTIAHPLSFGSLDGCHGCRRWCGFLVTPRR